VRTVKLADGRALPIVGQGTWEMGVRPGARNGEVAALKLGLDLGMTLIDTAEMYGSGGAEEVVARAIEGRRDSVFLVSKVLPSNATRAGTIRACERSLKRLRTDRLDLYLLHWHEDEPLEETIAAFVELKAAGKILGFGVSNFDESLLPRVDSACSRASKEGATILCDQVLYNLARRGIEWALLPELRRRGVLCMAYSPLDERRLELTDGPTTKRRRALHGVAEKLNVTPAQVALAWAIREPGIVTIPKAVSLEHVRENAEAAALVLPAAELARLDEAYPPPTQAQPLEMI
jgi:diketogulonate reductase-like aldo/keto reductase